LPVLVKLELKSRKTQDVALDFRLQLPKQNGSTSYSTSENWILPSIQG